MNTSAFRVCHQKMLLKMNFGFLSIQQAKTTIFSTYLRLIYLVSLHCDYFWRHTVWLTFFERSLKFFLSDEIFEFWQNIWKRSQKSVVIIQLDPTDSNYFKEQELRNEMTLK